MKTIPMAALIAGATIFMLSACGAGNDAADTSSRGATEGAAAAAATPANRDWMPAAIVLPQPHTVVADNRLGMRTHLLQIVVQNDPTPQFAQWRSALVAAGYDVLKDDRDDQVLFSGADVDSGQVVLVQTPDQPGFMIQVDVTRRQ